MHIQGELLSTRGLGPSALCTVAWSPDGKMLACGNTTGQVFLIEAHSAKRVASYQAHTGGYVSQVVWSPDQRQLLTGTQNGLVVIWDVVTQKALMSYQHGEDEEPITACAWSADPSRIASSGWQQHPSVQVREARTGDLLSTFFPHTVFGETQHLAVNAGDRVDNAGCFPLCWSPVGEYLAIGQMYVLHLWQPATGQVLSYSSLLRKEPQDTPLYMSHLAWSPNGEMLAFACRMAIEVWRWDTQETQAYYRGHTDFLRGLHWLPDGKRLLSVGKDEVHLWDVSTAACTARSLFAFGGEMIAMNGETSLMSASDPFTVSEATFSPDAAQVAFVGSRYLPQGEEEGMLWVGRHHLPI